MELNPWALSVFLLFLACAAVGGCLALLKRRWPLEGVLLGLFLGPIGVLIESSKPYVRRPEVDQAAWTSFRSMVTYQTEQEEARAKDRARRRQGARANSA